MITVSFVIGFELYDSSWGRSSFGLFGATPIIFRVKSGFFVASPIIFAAKSWPFLPITLSSEREEFTFPLKLGLSFNGYRLSMVSVLNFFVLCFLMHRRPSPLRNLGFLF
ncbi:hypothetical protein CIPAW_15G070900 [Carya illinoinensis]|uniref:Uncharacterized protein n=1 Tax=Carya illinoinensis TaxID=32201 RepID=A0A8T1NAY9_CARIL|nr:hypothetical protein CIPAW_15G070900 [Carya illinoinensis]